MLDIDSEGCLDSYSKIVLTPKKITSLAKKYYFKPPILSKTTNIELLSIHVLDLELKAGEVCIDAGDVWIEQYGDFQPLIIF
jgi:hypothetical protein